MPLYTGFSTVATFANLGLPGLCGFVGEFMVLLGTFQAARPGSLVMSSGVGSRGAVHTLAVIACFGVVLAAGYMLWMMQRVFFGRSRPELAKVPEVTQREVIVLTPLALMCILLGILPAMFVLVFTDKTVAVLIDVLK